MKLNLTKPIEHNPIDVSIFHCGPEKKNNIAAK